MSFQNPILGGETLIRSGIKGSYVPGVSGWRVGADGSAEFNGLVARGGMQTPGGYKVSDSGIIIPVSVASGNEYLTAHFDQGNNEGIYWKNAAGDTLAYIERRSDGTLMIYNENGKNIDISTGPGKSALLITGSDSNGGNIYASGRIQGRIPTIALTGVSGNFPSNPTLGVWNYVITNVAGTSPYNAIAVDTQDHDILTQDAGRIFIAQNGLYSISYSMGFGMSTNAGSRGIGLFNDTGAAVYGRIEVPGNPDNAHQNQMSGTVTKALAAGDDVIMQYFTTINVPITNAALSVSFLGWANLFPPPPPPTVPPPPPPPVFVTTEYYALDAKTFRSNAWDATNVKQGNYGYGDNTGYFLNDYGKMQRELAGKTIDKCEIYLIRQNGGGAGAAQNVGLYDHGLITLGVGGGGQKGLSYGPVGSYSWGQGHWTTVSNTLAQRFQSGACAGWCMFGGAYGLYDNPGQGSGSVRISYH